MLPVKDTQGNLVPGVYRIGTPSHELGISSSSAAMSTGFSDGTRMVRVTPTANCFVNFGGTNVQASNSDTFLLANQHHDLAVPNNAKRIAVLQHASATGTLFIAEYK